MERLRGEGGREDIFLQRNTQKVYIYVVYIQCKRDFAKNLGLSLGYRWGVVGLSFGIGR